MPQQGCLKINWVRRTTRVPNSLGTERDEAEEHGSEDSGVYGKYFDELFCFSFVGGR